MASLRNRFTAFSSIAGVDTPWTNPANAQAADGVLYATSSVVLTTPTDSLRGEALLTKLPRNAVPVGIGIAVTKYADGLATDDTVHLHAGAASDEKATSNDWPIENTTVQYGGATDLWGLTPTRAQLNGVFRCDIEAATTELESIGVSVDAIIPTIYYRRTHGPCRASRRGFLGRMNERAPL